MTTLSMSLHQTIEKQRGRTLLPDERRPLSGGRSHVDPVIGLQGRHVSRLLCSAFGDFLQNWSPESLETHYLMMLEHVLYRWLSQWGPAALWGTLQTDGVPSALPTCYIITCCGGMQPPAAWFGGNYWWILLWPSISQNASHPNWEGQKKNQNTHVGSCPLISKLIYLSCFSNTKQKRFHRVVNYTRRRSACFHFQKKVNHHN